MLDDKPVRINQRIPQPRVLRWLGLEAALLIIVTLSVWLIDDVMAKSALIGGLVYLIPQGWFAYRAFRFQGARAAPLVVKNFYRGEAGKFLLTTIAFVASFSLVRPMNVLVFFSAFAALNLINVLIVARMMRS